MHLSDHLAERFPVLGMQAIFAKRQFIVLDDFLPDSIVSALTRECNNWHQDHPNPFGYFRNMRRFVEEAYSSQTIRWLEGVTGLEGFRGEPHLETGGYGHGRSPWPVSTSTLTLDLHFGKLASTNHRKPVNTAHNRCYIYTNGIDYTGEVQGLRLTYS